MHSAQKPRGGKRRNRANKNQSNMDIGLWLLIGAAAYCFVQCSPQHKKKFNKYCKGQGSALPCLLAIGVLVLVSQPAFMAAITARTAMVTAAFGGNAVPVNPMPNPINPIPGPVPPPAPGPLGIPTWALLALAAAAVCFCNQGKPCAKPCGSPRKPCKLAAGPLCGLDAFWGLKDDWVALILGGFLFVWFLPTILQVVGSLQNLVLFAVVGYFLRALLCKKDCSLTQSCDSSDSPCSSSSSSPRSSSACPIDMVSPPCSPQRPRCAAPPAPRCNRPKCKARPTESDSD